MIVSKTYFFNVHGPAGVFFKGVSSLPVLYSAGNMDALLDDVSGSDDVSLASESELSSDESVIVSSAARTHFSSLIALLVRSVFQSILSLVYHSHHF